MNAPNALTCPRCNTPLTPPRSADGAEPATAESALCGRCGGQWVEREALRRVDAVMEQLPLHHDEVMRHETRFGGISTCPGCRSVPLTFAFFEVLIDWCPACGGVWFDGGEVADLKTSIETLRQQGGDAGFAHFRQQAADAITIGTVRCKDCGAPTLLNETWMGTRGPLCPACGHRFRYGVEAGTKEELEALDRAMEPPASGLRALFRAWFGG